MTQAAPNKPASSKHASRKPPPDKRADNKTHDASRPEQTGRQQTRITQAAPNDQAGTAGRLASAALTASPDSSWSTISPARKLP